MRSNRPLISVNTREMPISHHHKEASRYLPFNGHGHTNLSYK